MNPSLGDSTLSGKGWGERRESREERPAPGVIEWAAAGTETAVGADRPVAPTAEVVLVPLLHLAHLWVPLYLPVLVKFPKMHWTRYCNSGHSEKPEGKLRANMSMLARLLTALRASRPTATGA